MPKVIKSDSVEEGRPFIVELPEGAFSADISDNGDADCLRFFEKTASADSDVYDEDEKYYLSINKNAGSVEEPGEPEQAPAEGGGEESDGVEKDGVGNYPEDDLQKAEDIPDGRPAIEQSRVSPEEEAQKIIELAKEKAAKILADVRREAESARMNLSAEISEGEVKTALAKHIATDIVEEANAEAAKRLAQAEEEARGMFEEAKNKGRAEGLEAGKEDGYKEGFVKGKEEGEIAGREDGMKEGKIAGEAAGRAEGMESARREMADQLAGSTQKAKKIIIDAEKEKEKIIDGSSEKILQIAMAVAEKILNKEISENPFIILQIVKEAAQKVADQPRLFITVSTDNYDIVCAARDDIKKALGSKQEITFAADGTLGPADAVIGTGGSGDVDARLKTQVDEIRKTIEAVMRQ